MDAFYKHTSNYAHAVLFSAMNLVELDIKFSAFHRLFGMDEKSQFRMSLSLYLIECLDSVRNNERWADI